MATAARDRLARELRGDVESAFSAQLTAQMDGLSLEVEGFGRVKLPVTPAKARKLIALGKPARFGRGEETLTDPEVRDTWEIPTALVRAQWDDSVLADVLATVKEKLGFPNASRLTAELHSLLVYEPDQFFLPHQDSEKSDDMVATLVVTLPSRFTGGELLVWHNEERRTYQGSRTALSLAAFYADCRHEVLKVQSGYRITLTYNLLLRGDTSRPAGDEGTVAELESLLREHFSTPIPRYYGDKATDPPRRLAYLLDHEYTPRALNWSRLKGDDASRASLLRDAADRAGCEAILALANIQDTHGAHPANDGFGYRQQGWHDDFDEEVRAEGRDGEGEYVVHELITSQVRLTHWTGPGDAGLAETSLHVRQAEACASTPSGDLKPYSQEYEGYMGNWGNTLDRWYHRAAIVLWPLDLAFANRAETSPAWALDELGAMASSGDLTGARAKAGTLAPLWGDTVRAHTGRGNASGLFGKALRAAEAVADAGLAAMLLRPFAVGNLTDKCAKSFASIAGRYGQQWTAELLRAWFGVNQPASGDAAGRDIPQWAADRLPGLCERLRITGFAGMDTARWLIDLTWERIGKDIGSALASSWPSYRDSLLSGLGRPLAGVLSAAAAIGAVSTRDMVTGHVRLQGDAVTALEVSALRAALATPSEYSHSDAGLDVLASDCAERLRARIARPEREADDWSVELPVGGCACDLCGTLRKFLTDRNRRTFEWPLAEDGRQHVRSRIDSAELPVTHLTTRQGRPDTLVLSKTDALFALEQQARASDEADLAWLDGECEAALATR